MNTMQTIRQRNNRKIELIIFSIFFAFLISCEPFRQSFRTEISHTEKQSSILVDSLNDITRLAFRDRTLFRMNLSVRNTSNENIKINLNDLIFLEQQGNSFEMTQIIDLTDSKSVYSLNSISLEPKSERRIEYFFKSKLHFKNNVDWKEYSDSLPVLYSIRHPISKSIVESGVLESIQINN